MVIVVALLAGVLGALVGSFLNVVILRVPAGESVVRPASACPRCGTGISVRDNIPVFSWLLLRGRGRCCGEPISARYPLIEGATAVSFAVVTWWLFGVAQTPGWTLRGAGLMSVPGLLAWLTMMYLVAVSLVLSVIDIDVKRLPAMIVLQAWAVVGIGLTAAALVAGNGSAAVRLVIGALAVWGLYRVLHLVYPAGMAYGDVRLAAVIGGATAWVAWSATAVGTFAGFLLGALGGLALISRQGGGRKTQVPFGPYMLAGMWLGIFVGPALFARYLAVVVP